MDSQQFQPAEAREPFEVTPQLSYDGYDESALGVECAWPQATPREVTRSPS